MPENDLPVPDEERVEPPVRDDRDPGAGSGVDGDDIPATGVIDDEAPIVPEPNEPA